MKEMVLILIASAGVLGLSQWLRLPPVPLLILAGIGMTLTSIAPESTMLQNVLMLGLAFLVFAAGMELDPRRAGRQRRAAIGIGLIQFLVMGAVGAAAAIAMGTSWFTALYVGLGISASSTIIVVRILRQRRQFFEPFGRAVLGALLVQDALVILALAVLSSVAAGAGAVAFSVIGTVSLGACAWAFARWAAPFLLVRLKPDQEEGLLVALAVLFMFVGLADWLDLPIAVGAFLAGIALSSFPVNGIVRGQLTSLSNFFLAVFFVSLGASLDIPGLREIMLTAILVFLIVVVTPPLVVVIAERMGLSTRASVEAGLLLAQCSEFSLIVAILGVDRGHLDTSMLSVLALTTVVSMMLTSFIATDSVVWKLVQWHPSRATKRIGPPPKDHIVLLGCGSNSRILLDLLLLQGNTVLVVDEDPAVVEALRERGVDVIRGDGADERVLEEVRAREARVIISTMRRIEDNERLLRLIRGRIVVVRAFDEHAAKRIAAAGGIPATEAEPAAESLLHWVTTSLPRAEKTSVA
ncbi:MAG TPA: cation:proton antiporter [Phycisphaerales bacterium]|nr:cation:proton antiporter [Phycisphaerales bacterium]